MGQATMMGVIDRIIGVLFAAEDRRLQGWIDRLCKMNQEAMAQPVTGFLFDGIFYRPSHIVGPVPHKRALHASLWPEMSKLKADREAVQQDKAFIRQGLYLVLDACKTNEDIRNALPECLIDCLPQLRGLERTAEPAFTIQDNPRHLRQFNKVLPKMELYSAARLVC